MVATHKEILGNKYDQTISFLKTLFPDSETDLEGLFLTDASFREIVLELEECKKRRDKILRTTGKESLSYRDTIQELMDRLQDYRDALHGEK
jgi:hypothetical protein